MTDASYARRLRFVLRAVERQLLEIGGECILVWVAKEPIPESILHLCGKTDTWVIPARPDPGPFNLSRARNIGGVRAFYDDLVFVDADVILDPDMLGVTSHQLGLGDRFVTALTVTMPQGLNPGKHFFEPEPFRRQAGKLPIVSCGFGGYLAVRRSHYRKVGGYDEGFEGWGSEDCDFVDRLVWSGLEHTNLSERYGMVVMHQWHPRRFFESVDCERNRRRYFEMSSVARNPGGYGKLVLRTEGERHGPENP